MRIVSEHFEKASVLSRGFAQLDTHALGFCFQVPESGVVVEFGLIRECVKECTSGEWKMI